MLRAQSQTKKHQQTQTRRLDVNVVAISANTGWFLCNFRKGLIRSLRQADFRVLAMAPDDGYGDELRDLGCEVIKIPMRNKSVNPLTDLWTISAYFKAYRKHRPVAALNFTIKPVIYGSLAGSLLGIPSVNMITGLGTAFIRESWLTRIVETMYRFSQRKAQKIFFLNENDHQLFSTRRLAPSSAMETLPGEGIDLEHFKPTPKAIGEPVQFLFIGRIIADKGIFEFVRAAEIVRESFPDTRFGLLGPLEVPNRTAISRKLINNWEAEGVLQYFGKTEDVRPFVTAADCIVLPSYREGSSRTLMEAAALARPSIATDTPGCREIVEDGVTGLLCQVRDAGDLARQMIRVIRMNPRQRLAMGAAARAKAERDFDERVIARRYLQVVDAIVRGREGAERGRGAPMAQRNT